MDYGWVWVWVWARKLVYSNYLFYNSALAIIINLCLFINYHKCNSLSLTYTCIYVYFIVSLGM